MSTLAERFARKYEPEPNTGCWLWTAFVDAAGYGRINSGARASGGILYAHRVSYELHVGPIPAGLQLDHLCRVRSCVNPAHLEPVTAQENTSRGLGAAKPCCARGHALCGTNVRLYRGARVCRTCHRDRERARHSLRPSLVGGAS